MFLFGKDLGKLFETSMGFFTLHWEFYGDQDFCTVSLMITGLVGWESTAKPQGLKPCRNNPAAYYPLVICYIAIENDHLVR